MADDEKIVYRLDLDAAEFMKTLKEVNTRLGTLEKTAKTASPVLYFEMAKIAVDGFKYAVELAGKVLDTVLEGENVRAINLQFESLTRNAGIATDVLRDGLEKAGKGLIDDTDLLETANKAIVTMGSSAAKLPEILDTARRATALFGGDFKNNFDSFTQAIATGNIRGLKQFGIVVDTEKAVRDYAKSLGVTVGSLTELERKQASSNAALEQAKKKYKEADLTLHQTGDSWVRLKNSINDASESISVFISRKLGPIFKSAFDSAAESVSGLSTRFKAMFSADAKDRAVNTLKDYEDRLVTLKDKLKALDQGERGIIAQIFGKNIEKERDDIVQKILSVEGVINLQRDRLKDMGVKTTPPPAESEDSGALEKRAAANTKFEQDLLEMRKSSVSQRLEVESNGMEQEKLIAEQYDLLYQEKELKERAVDQEFKAGDLANFEQTEQKKQQIREQYDAQVRALYMSQDSIRMKAYENELKMASSTSEGTAAAFKLGGAQATKALNDFGAQGTRRFNMLNSAAANAFSEMGKGSKTASEIMKGFILGMIADEAQYTGQLYLAEGIATLNPGKIAGGGALIALSQVVRSAGGNGASSGGGGSGGGGGGPESPGFKSEGPAPDQVAAPKKQVTIQIQGSYFETDQTKQRLMEMIRDQTDATDFKYVQIGGT